MVFTSAWISQSIQSQNSMFSGMQAYAAQASYASGLMGGGSPPPPMAPMPPPPPTMLGVMQGYGGYAGGPTAGAWGDAFAGRMASWGQAGVGLAGAGVAGLGVASSLGLVGGALGTASSMMDPLGLTLRAGFGAFGAAGGGFGGLAAGGLAAGAVALPAYAGIQYVSALGRNFYGGMQDQMALNSTLRQNFNFMGGQGAYGRGFSQSQMGEIGGFVSQELRNNVFTSAGELNQVIAGGAQAGTFTGVRDVQEFRRRFQEMISTLRTVQRELGGSLAEAQEFISQSRQAGVFGSTAATRFASTIRGISASTGFDQGQLLQLASQGAQISRTFGGNGNQGAFGALRGISTISTAMQGGMISEEMLSEATGGLTGQDAMQSFVTGMMQRTGRFSRRAMGRYSIFGLANRDGTGLDEGALMRFSMGDMGVGELSRRAHGRVGEMGRARAINREGLLRGALMEQGGVGGQIGMMRQMIGDRVMDQGDDMVSLVLQRRFQMSRPEAEIMTSLMRNQGTIARNEIADSVSSRREQDLRNDVRENRSLDSFMRHLSHSLQEDTGMTRARELGREFITGVSSRLERAMNTFLGVADTSMTSEVRQRFGRLSMGAGTSSDQRFAQLAMEGWRPQTVGAGDLFGRNLMGLSIGERMERMGFNPLGFGSGRSGTALRESGVDVRGNLLGVHADGSRVFQRGSEMSTGAVTEAMNRMSLASSGIANGRAGELLSSMQENTEGTRAQILRAMRAARGQGDESQFYSFMGRDRSGRSTLSAESGLATTAFMAQQGMYNPITMSRVDIEMANRDDSLMGRAHRALGQLFGTSESGDIDGFGVVATAATAGIVPAALRSMQRGTSSVSAEEYFAAGGGAASDLRRTAGTLRSGRGRGSSEAQLQRAIEYEGRARAISGGSVEETRAVMARTDVRQASMMMLSEDATERRRGLETLRSLEGAESNPGARQALSSMVENAERVAGGSGDSSAREAFRRVVISHDDEVAFRRETEALGRSFNALGGLFQNERTGGGMLFGTMISDAGAAFGRGQNGYTGLNSTMTNIATLSDSDFNDAMNAASGALGNAQGEDRDRLRGLMTQAMQTHRDAREIMGRGRRGRRGSQEAGLSFLSGSALGSMEFEINGRRVGQRNAAGMMLGGGRYSEQMMSQFQEQLGRQMGAPAAEEIASTLRDVYGAQGEGGRNVTEGEYRRMAALRQRYGDQFERIEQEGQQRALSAATARDPIGREQINILNRIHGVLDTRLRAQEGGVEPNMSTPTG